MVFWSNTHSFWCETTTCVEYMKPKNLENTYRLKILVIFSNCKSISKLKYFSLVFKGILSNGHSASFHMCCKHGGCQRIFRWLGKVNCGFCLHIIKRQCCSFNLQKMWMVSCFALVCALRTYFKLSLSHNISSFGSGSLHLQLVATVHGVASVMVMVQIGLPDF